MNKNMAKKSFHLKVQFNFLQLLDSLLYEAGTTNGINWTSLMNMLTNLCMDYLAG